MNIIVNALSARRGGGQVYIHHLLENLPNNNNYTVFLLAPDSLISSIPKFNFNRIDFPEYIIKYPIFRTIWEFIMIPIIVRRLSADILFCPGGSITGKIPNACKIVTTFQNMLPFDVTQRQRYAFGYMKFRNWMLHKKLMSSMLKSNLVIFISEYAKSVIIGESKNRIKNCIVIPHGINCKFRRDPENKLPLPFWLPKSGYILYVSIFDVYKSQIEVVEAYSLLKRKYNISYKLVLVGPEYEPYGKKLRSCIESHGLKNDVLLKDSIPNDSLPAVYQNAVVNIFASKTENCPFILLEALAAGRPLLVSNYLPMPEFGGDAVLYFDPLNPSELADRLYNLLNNEEQMNLYSKKALDRSFKYNWDETCNTTWNSIIEIGS